MWNLLLQGVIKYVEAHPEVIEQLIGEAITAGLDALKAHNSKPTA